MLKSIWFIWSKKFLLKGINYWSWWLRLSFAYLFSGFWDRKNGLVDFDKVEISNLNRQTLFNTNDIGKFKVSQAKKVINKINGDIKLFFLKRITKNNIGKICKKFDIICDGTDNYETRYIVIIV